METLPEEITGHPGSPAYQEYIKEQIEAAKKKIAELEAKLKGGKSRKRKASKKSRRTRRR